MTMTASLATQAPEPFSSGDESAREQVRWKMTDPLWDPASAEFAAALSNVWAGVKRSREEFARFAKQVPAGALSATALERLDADWTEQRESIQELYVFLECKRSLGETTKHLTKNAERIRRIATAHKSAPTEFVGVMLKAGRNASDLFPEGAPEEVLKRWQSWERDEEKSKRNEQTDRLGGPGYRQWWQAYRDTRAQLYFHLPKDGIADNQVSVVEATRLLAHPVRSTRERIFTSVETAWQPHRTMAAHALTGRIAWRCRAAEIKGEDRWQEALAETSLSRGAVERCLEAANALRVDAQAALTAQAHMAGYERLAPWDLDASSNWVGPVPLNEALRDTERAFNAVDPEMAGFFRLMMQEGWLDASPHQAGRRTADFQTSIARRGVPLVLVSYDGHALNAIRIAHETSHAHHFWCIKDLPMERHYVPTASAETVASFAELLLRSQWQRSGENSSQHPCAQFRRYAWMEAQAFIAFALMLPANFTFERQLTDAPFPHTPEELDQRFTKVWLHWFGENKVSPDVSAWYRKPVFIASQFHGLPYIAGFFLAHFLEAQRQALGPQFAGAYTSLLRSMAQNDINTAFKTTFGADLEEEAVWETCLSVMRGRLNQLMTLVLNVPGEAASYA